MKYMGMPFGMWLLFGKYFQENLTAIFNLTLTEAKSVMSKAKRKYKAIIEKLPNLKKATVFR